MIIIAATHRVSIINICDIVSIEDRLVIIYKDLLDKVIVRVRAIAAIIVIDDI